MERNEGHSSYRGRVSRYEDAPSRDYHNRAENSRSRAPRGGGGRYYNRNSRSRSRSRSRDRDRRRSHYDDRDYAAQLDDYAESRAGNYNNNSYSSSPPPSGYRHNNSDRANHNHHRSSNREDYRGGFDRRDRDKGYPSTRNYSPNPNYHQQGGSSHHRNDYDDDYDSYESDSADRYASPRANKQLVIRGLAPHITEAEILSDLMQYNLKPVSLRLLRKRDSGASRGFAFVEFSTEEEATRWMEFKQGVVVLQGQYQAFVQYSNSRGHSSSGGGGGGHSDRDKGASNSNPNITDWYCSKCLVFNFKRRDNCFKCYASREESERGGEGWDEISNVLTKKIILRNLDVLTNEESVLTALQEKLPLELVAKVAKILICRDPLTNTSRGICYLAFDTLVDSMNVFNGLKGLEQPLAIAGREVGISYCVDGSGAQGEQETVPGNGNNNSSRNNRQSSPSSRANAPHHHDEMSAGANVAPGNGSQGVNTHHYTMADVPRLAEYSAKLYATNAAEHDHYNKYYTQYYVGQIQEGQFANLPTMGQLGETANSGAAVAQSAMQRKQQQGKFHKGPHHQRPEVESKPRFATPKGDDGKRYPVPDISKYQYEETSGYYYDPTTGLYYDSNSQYYYNSETSSYLYWDGENSTYKVAPTAAAAAAQPESNSKADDAASNQTETSNDGERAPDKVKVAKKIVKDMEKWAKQLNQKKDMGGALHLPVPVKEEHPLRQSSASLGNGCADVGFAILEKKDKLPLALEPMGPIKTTPSAIAGSNKLVAYGSDSDNEGGEAGDREPINEKDYVDFEKLTCLLCKRAFQSQEILAKHIKLSDLHKQNLAKFKLAKAVETAGSNAEQSYRDRAKERRKKYGEADPPPLNKSRERFQKEIEKQASIAAINAAASTSAAPIGGGNMGNKLLQKMGWQEGQGLGRANQGRTNIIEVESRAGGAGLGTKSAGPPFAGGDYKTYIKRMMKQRYEQTE